MGKLVVLSFFSGDLQTGFPAISARISNNNNQLPSQCQASLPAAPQLVQIHQRWRLLYSALSQCTNSTRIQIEQEDILQVSRIDFDSLCQQLKTQLNAWLNTKDFQAIDQKLRRNLDSTEQIRLVIESDNEQLRQLPWHLWLFCEEYPHTEIILSRPEYEQVIVPKQNEFKKVRILAVLGNSEGIDIKEDREILEQLPQSQTEFLVEPQRQEFNQYLWQEKGWDILFFAGHSSSDNNGQTGRIELNQNESLTIPDLKYALEKAIRQGLQLAIFNSCDGLGLALELASLQIPHLIVMREPVPDLVAQEFLKGFLDAFSSRKSLVISLREAREKLQGLESICPCASWLPVLCQNPTAPALKWQDLYHQFPYQKLIKIVAISFFITVLVVGLRFLGILQSQELQAFDHLMRQRPHEQPDPRLLIVQATPEDIAKDLGRKKKGASLSDKKLTLLLKKLQEYEPMVIGLDIYRDFAAEPELAPYLQQENLFGMCKVKAMAGDKDAKIGVKPPPEITGYRLGFSDAIADSDGILRRHLLSMKPPVANDPCLANNHLSFLLALYYLDQKNIPWQNNPKSDLKIGEVLLKALKYHTGGYQDIDAGGRQIMLNYRSLYSARNVAKTVSVSDILEEEGLLKRKEEFKGRIILIGVSQSRNDGSGGDYWATPYGEEIPGLFIQGHMVSQIISAVLDQRPLLWILPGGLELIWIWLWAIIGGIIAYWLKKPLHLAIATAISLTALYGICYLLICQGGWLPLIPAIIVLLLTAMVIVIRKKLD